MERCTLESLKSLADRVLPVVFPHKTVKTRIETGPDEDPNLKIYVGTPEYDESGIRVYWEKRSDQGVFLVTVEVLTPGCHTLSNGDPGWPDEYDEVEVGPADREGLVVKAVIALPGITRFFPKHSQMIINACVNDLIGDKFCHSENAAISLVVDIIIKRYLDVEIEAWDYEQNQIEEQEYENDHHTNW